MSTTKRVAEIVASNGGGDIDGRSSFLGESVDSGIHGQFAENTLRGRMFAYGISSQALLIKSNGTGFPTIWNPAGSGMVFVPVAVVISFISGTTVIGAVNWAVTLNTGAVGNIGTGLPIVTFTNVAASNMSVGGTGRASAMQFAPTTVTFTTAPTFLCATGINLGAAAPTGTGTYEAVQNGRIVIYPGTALSLVYTVTTSTAVFAQTIYGLELPMPTGL